MVSRAETAGSDAHGVPGRMEPEIRVSWHRIA